MSSTEASYLLNTQYADAGNLNARIQLHERFSTNREDLHHWIFTHLLDTLGPEAQILEVGCGPADLWRKNLERLPAGWRVTLTDFSPGMIEAARAAVAPRSEQFTLAVANVQELPFADSSFDAVVADYMLYHVPDRPRALAELRRVLRAGGHLFAATNGAGHMRELDEMIAPYLPEIAAYRPDLLPALAQRMPAIQGEGFTLENGAEQLEAAFANVRLDTIPDGLIVTEAAPLIAYLRSISAGLDLPPDLVERFSLQIEQQIATDGAIRITKATGLFLADAL